MPVMGPPERRHGSAGERPAVEQPTAGSQPGEPVGAPRRWLAELAWLPGHGVQPGVLIEAAGERITAVTPGLGPAASPAGTVRLPGLTLPGLANAHSHAFHHGVDVALGR